MKTITFRIPLRGISTGARNMVVEVDGVKGESCKDLSATFIKQLGIVADETVKADMYESEDRVEKLTQGDGGGG